MNFLRSCKAGGVQTGPVVAETSAEFAKCRRWAREMAHRFTQRGDGSVLVLQPNGLLVVS